MGASERSQVPRTRRTGLLIASCYVATVILANYAIEAFGAVPVGFGLLAPAGVYFAGLAFTLRDLTQDRLGKRAVLLAILVGSALSGLVSTQFALASAAAFLLSELADFAVYTPLRERGWLPAVILSNIVGFVVDSLLFLWLAFGSLAFLPGQLVGKAWMTVLAIAVLMLVRRGAGRRNDRNVEQEGRSLHVGAPN